MVYVFCFINKNQWEFDDRISMQLHGTYIIILIYNENVLLDPIQIDGFPADVLRKTCLFILIFKFKVTYDLPRFDRSKKDITIHTVIYIYCCYVIKYIDVTVLK